MIFNSLEFLIFFVLVTTAYFLLPHRLRWALLLSPPAQMGAASDRQLLFLYGICACIYPYTWLHYTH